jgi:hypothetical protein
MKAMVDKTSTAAFMKGFASSTSMGALLELVLRAAGPETASALLVNY